MFELVIMRQAETEYFPLRSVRQGEAVLTADGFNHKWGCSWRHEDGTRALIADRRIRMRDAHNMQKGAHWQPHNMADRWVDCERPKVEA